MHKMCPRNPGAILLATTFLCISPFLCWKTYYTVILPEVDMSEWTFAPSFLSFLESNFALLWYKTLHSEVVWTEQNAGKSEFTLFADWLITLHKVLMSKHHKNKYK